jgi:hypothetical protein
MVLIILTFCLTIFGTFLTAAASSLVHSFTQSASALLFSASSAS